MPGSPSQPSKNNLWLYIVIAVVVLALIGGAVYWFGFHKSNNDNPSGGGSGTTSTSAPPATTPAAAVQGYLSALAAGDAAKALSYVSTKPTDTTFLTDAVLAAGNKIAPITNIQIGAVAAGDVQVTYSIGGQQVSTDYQTTPYQKQYLLLAAVDTMDLSDIYQPGIGMTLNGVTLDGLSLSQASLFPGSYQLATTNSLLAFTPSTFVIQSPSDYNFPDIDTELAPTSQATLAAAAKAKLDGCLQEKALTNSCGFGMNGIEGSGTPDPSTVTWKINSGSDSFSTTQFQTQYASPTTVTGYNNIDLTETVKDTAGSTYTFDTFVGEVTIDITDPNNLVVTFD